jgi:hypothetical protein
MGKLVERLEEHTWTRVGEWEVSREGATRLVDSLTSDLQALEPNMTREQCSKILWKILGKLLDDGNREYLRWVMNTMIRVKD